MNQSVDVVNVVSTLLDSGKYKEALNVPNEEIYKEVFKDNCWDLIAVVIGKVQDDTITLKPSLYGACEELLAVIIDKTAPEEALLEFIEQIELAKNDAQFSIILTPLQHILKKLPTKRGRSIEWSLNSISTYIENIPIPEYQLEGKERLLMDCDQNIRRISKVYSMLPSFYRPFMDYTMKEQNLRSKQALTAFLISLLGKPMIYIDLDPESNEKSESRQCCTTIIEDVCILEKNVLKFFTQLENCSKESNQSKSNKKYDDEYSPYEQREKINMTTLSGLFYIVFSDHIKIPDVALPQVYSNDYIVHTTMLCVIYLLTFTEYGPLLKATSLFESILARLSNNASHTLLSSSVHFNVCKNLINVCVYSTYESIRKKALNLITAHINKFDYKGRCILIKYLIDAANHSGLIGYAITMYKNTLNEAFDSCKLNSELGMPDCFTGVQLIGMLKKICHLPHGAESDLMELADQIIAALNFLRYLVLKDTDNLTGFRDLYSTIEADYLDNLRTGINMSKAHYEVKLKEIEEGKKQPGEKSYSTLNVGGNVIDTIPTENKKEIIQSALNAFHLMECLLARLTECFSAIEQSSVARI